jgi:hypothetical protein
MIFLYTFFKNTQISSFIKIRPVGAELFHEDGRTDRMNLIVAFRNFAKETTKEGGKQKIKCSIRLLADRKKREVANLLIELYSKKSYDFQNYRCTDSQLFRSHYF